MSRCGYQSDGTTAEHGGEMFWMHLKEFYVVTLVAARQEQDFSLIPSHKTMVLR